MYQIVCPYCSNSLVNDGSLAGQLVFCPYCGGQMQMPGTIPPPVFPQYMEPHPPPAPPLVNATESHPILTISTIEGGGRSHNRGKGKSPDAVPLYQLIIGGALFAAILLGWMVQNGTSSEQRKVYLGAYETGWIAYEEGLPAGFSESEYLQLSLDMLALKSDPHYFRRWRSTYEVGFSDGYHKREKQY